jgi:phosphate transport system permease protein
VSAEAVLPDRPTMGAAASNLPGRQTRARVVSVLLLVATSIGLLALAVLLVTVVARGWSWITPEFFTRAPSRLPERSGIAPALLGTIWVVTLTAVVGFPLGILAAIYLEEYAPRNWWTRVLNVNISNLAGVPSVVYGLLGLGIFVEWMRFGRSILSGALALALLMLPIVIIASREALRAVPPSLREAAYGVGATKWQVVRHHVLPAALPGVLTGTILALATAVGETAPLLVTGAVAYITYNPSSIMDRYTVLPVQIFNWSSRPQDEFRELASAAILVLLAVLLVLSATAVVLRQRASRKTRW